MSMKTQLDSLCSVRECFAYDPRQMNCCIALEDVHFKHSCPFYKTKDKNDCDRYLAKMHNEQYGVEKKEGYIDVYDR